MIQTTVNETHLYTIDGTTINGEEHGWDLLKVDERTFHIIRDNQSYRATVVNINHEEKTMTITVNGNDYEVSIKDKYDLLLREMGISSTTTAQINNLKAPMPGLIREIIATAGSEVKKGDIVLILEAMKMENALKSPRDGKIKKVNISAGDTVEKGFVLLDFE
jgi:acetyl/propionyl-CoA carboxylase alpha subunit